MDDRTARQILEELKYLNIATTFRVFIELIAAVIIILIIAA